MSDLFDFEPRPPAFAVVGNPVAHSKSPQIHQAFGEHTGIALSYERSHVDVGGFEQAVDAFAANGGRGLNVTVPFKVEAWRYVDHRSERAEQAQAVNTIRFDDDGSHGENTDGVGFMRDLSINHDYDIRDRRVLVVGAGGAVQGLAAQLLLARPEVLIIANRTVDKAVSLAKQLQAEFEGDVRAAGYSDLDQASPFDLIIHATSAGLSGQRPPVPSSLIRSDTVAYDLVYGDAARPFLDWAKSHGADRCLDGLGMLVEQAAESFCFWHGVRPPTAAVIESLRTGP